MAAGGDAGGEPGPDRQPGPDRDRDEAGRPRNARPRDGLGRPLNRGATGLPVMPPEISVTGDQALALAQRLIDEARPFHAHEVLEAAWKSAGPGQRDSWKGLAQIAVGLTHARRGNQRGAVALLRRGAGAITATAVPPVTGLDTSAVAAEAAGLADRIERDGLAVVPLADLRVRLIR
ncbi:MAG: DUF309 domain-containing protein [Streptosporangiaceae bacterium]